MKTAYVTHSDCMLHQLDEGHPERAARLSAISEHLMEIGLFTSLDYFDAPHVSDEQLMRVHTKDYLQSVKDGKPHYGLQKFGWDTVMMNHTLNAISRAAGAGIYATDLVMKGHVDNAFCNTRPPGHHAEPGRAVGFCFYNNIAIAAKHALQAHGLQRVSIVDFDAHHGNGTELIAADDSSIQYISLYVNGDFPFTENTSSSDNVVKIPLAPETQSAGYREAFSERCLPALSEFAPEMIFISAGFDGHHLDSLSNLRLVPEDYEWMTSEIMDIAKNCANHRIVSMLEGGYAFETLALSTASHLRALMQLYDIPDYEA